MSEKTLLFGYLRRHILRMCFLAAVVDKLGSCWCKDEYGLSLRVVASSIRGNVWDLIPGLVFTVTWTSGTFVLDFEFSLWKPV